MLGSLLKPSEETTTTTIGLAQQSDGNQTDRLVRHLLRQYPSKRNLDLLRRLNTSQLDYEIFYLEAPKSSGLSARNSRRATTPGANQQAGISSGSQTLIEGQLSDPFSLSTALLNGRLAAASWRQADGNQEAAAASQHSQQSKLGPSKVSSSSSTSSWNEFQTFRHNTKALW